MAYEAVIFDLGGVLLGSPLPAIAEYEREAGLPPGSIGGAVESSGASGAWARHERGEIGYREFCSLLESELAGAGLDVNAAALMARISAAIRVIPSMLKLVASVRAAGLKAAALTNNWAAADGAEGSASLSHHFDVFVESSKVGMRKPEPEIYHHVLSLLGTAPVSAVFLDDLGPNLKPARAMGMATIKVVEPEAAAVELESVLGISLPR